MATAHPGDRMTTREMKAMMSCKGGKSSKGKGDKGGSKSPKR